MASASLEAPSHQVGEIVNYLGLDWWSTGIVEAVPHREAVRLGASSDARLAAGSVQRDSLLRARPLLLALLLLTCMGNKALVAQETSTPQVNAFSDHTLSGLNALAEKWEQADWRPMLSVCVRREIGHLNAMLASEAAKYDSYTRRSQLDSAKAANGQLEYMAPLIARGRCKAKMVALTSFFASRDQVVIDLQDELKAHAQLEAMFADWLPARWAQVRAHMRVTGPNEFLRAGPWAVSDETLRLLMQGGSNDGDLEKSLSEVASRSAIDYLTLTPWVNGYNQTLTGYLDGDGKLVNLAVLGREELESKLGSQALVVERLVKSMFCELSRSPPPQGWSTPGYTLYDVCPTPAP